MVAVAATTENNTQAMDANVIRQKLVDLQVELDDCVLERKNVILGSMLALMTGTHLLQVGAPGAAKSFLTNILSKSTKAVYFHYLLSKFTTPDEIFGPVSLTALKQDRYVRVIAGKMPEAHIVFADEIFKSSSAILNTFLTILQERLYDNGEGMKRVPLVSCFAASNEYPASDELGALYDRFLQRFHVDYLGDDANLIRVLTGAFNTGTNTSISIEELEFIRQEINAVTLSPEALKGVITVKNYLADKFTIKVSDRRLLQSMQLVKAHAWLNGRTAAVTDDLFVFQNTLWDTQEQIDQVEEALRKLENKHLAKVKAIYDQFKTAYAELKGNPPQKYDIIKKLGDIGKEIVSERKTYEAQKDHDAGILARIVEIETLARKAHRQELDKESAGLK